MDLGLAHRVVVVVGGHGLIGSAVVDRLRTEGAITIPASRHTREGLELDARNGQSVKGAFEEILRRHGRLDGVVVTAAPRGGSLDPARTSEPGDVLEAVDAKAIAFLRVAGAAITLMRNAAYGRIVGVSGQNALMTGNLAGSVRNAAMIVVAKNLADSLVGTGITVNTVNPGTVKLQPSQEVQQGYAGEATPADVASMIVFLTSPISGMVSGESIAVGHRVRGVTSF
jgi:NAD(P)-dependent dehydrogenase (short-subunit alcohol dehydrogenase family)